MYKKKEEFVHRTQMALLLAKLTGGHLRNNIWNNSQIKLKINKLN